ncbi:DUF1327 domain-containing protein [Yersinia mollaretii]|uniref:DUF1327 domain-containing protein n=1 Tax=Yersinia mollaretii TaxID=33060 RepID=UPI0011A66B2E|nr:DUF1327 domain-containing protein [Yersinia mollaretii]
MNKQYELAVQCMTPKEDRIDVTISVVYVKLTGVSVCSLQVSVEREAGKDIAFYESESLQKAAETINDIANDLKEAA